MVDLDLMVDLEKPFLAQALEANSLGRGKEVHGRGVVELGPARDRQDGLEKAAEGAGRP